MTTPLLKNSASLQDLLQPATRMLTDAGIPDGRREAETLIAHALSCARLDLYRAGLQAYRDHRFTEAMTQFERALTHRDDGPARVYFRRARTFARNPPPEEWDGVHDLVLK